MKQIEQIAINVITGEKTIELIDIVDEPTHEPTPEELRQMYEQEVSNRIRQRYSIDEELSILRQRDVKVDKFEEYTAYCEACKESVRSVLNITR